MSAATSVLHRCPGCFTMQPWRAAKWEAMPTDRVVAHKCPHGKPCVQECAHGRRLHEFKLDGSDPPRVLCASGEPCVMPPREPCLECATKREDAHKIFVNSSTKLDDSSKRQVCDKVPDRCIVCVEIQRQGGGGGCPRWRMVTNGGNKVHKTDGRCTWCTFERPPPWCAGATKEETAMFVAAVAAEARPKALDAARKEHERSQRVAQNGRAT